MALSEKTIDLINLESLKGEMLGPITRALHRRVACTGVWIANPWFGRCYSSDSGPRPKAILDNQVSKGSEKGSSNVENSKEDIVKEAQQLLSRLQSASKGTYCGRWLDADKVKQGANRKKQPKDETGIFLDGANVPKNWRSNKNLPQWQRQMFALKEKLHESGGWKPGKKVSRDAMDKIRALKRTFPEINAGTIASHFQISPEAVRRILRSRWTPSEKEQQKIEERWTRRGQRIRAERDLDAIASGEWDHIENPEKILQRAKSVAEGKFEPSKPLRVTEAKPKKTHKRKRKLSLETMGF
uniref:Required for respiratory growth protein 9, mitochondrial n=1 Tax=Blastobotrys adeninivorans TaxID=409370 RepID=A0A060T232_BLAAD